MDPRKRFVEDLKGCLKQCRHKGDFLILASNSNKMLHITSPMVTFCMDSELCLQDVFGIFIHLFSATKVDKNRIDYVLMPPEVVLAIEHSRYLEFDKIFSTNHR
eukprot:456404-Ditylum_brightwellii.AAC.1